MESNAKLSYRELIVLAAAMIFTLYTVYGIHYGIAQIPSSSSPITDFAKSENEKLKSNSTFPVDFQPVIQVEYESNETLILKAKDLWLDSAGKVIDLAKQKGYDIDSVTTETESESKDISGTLHFDHWYGIFMSK
jgi:hypothetical protein